MTETDTAAPREISSIEELVSVVSLREVRVYSLAATATGPATEDPGDPDFEIEYAGFHNPDHLEDRFRFRATTADAEYSAEIAPIYELQEPCSIPMEIRIDFAERLAFMTAFPFIRESLVSSATRLGHRAPLLGLMRPGDFRINRRAVATLGADVEPSSGE